MLVRFPARLALLSGLFAAIAILTGCPAPPKAQPHVTQLEPAAPAPVIPPIDATELTPAQTTLPSLNDRAEPVLAEERLQFPSGLLPINSWARLCGFTEVHVAPNSNSQTIELESTEGVLTLFLGQRFAKWNGISLGLGYPPVPRNGQVMLNSIDVAKNAYPLGLGKFVIPKTRRTLVLDPGHGGADPGSRGATRNAVEKDLTLDWALRIERILTNSNWRVVLTRREDRDIPLMERVGTADSNEADLFISLHFNSLEKAGGARDESGIETYCLTPAGAPSNISRNFEDDLRRVYPNNEFDAQNILLAVRMQASLIRTTGRRDRGIRRARFMTVVREQKRPAVLIEGGFLSNPAEAGLLVQPSFREQMAQAVCNALPD